MLEIHNLCVHYGPVKAVDDLTLTLGQGEILSLVGPTGCGKSTTLRVIAGLERPSSGSIRIGERVIDPEHPVPPEQRQTGLVFQDFALFPHLTVEQNIGFKVRDPARLEHWLNLLGLAPYRQVMPHTLSGGQKQRVALARTLAHEPALVLLDEPLSNLDAALKDSLRWEIREALKTAGVPAIWVTHDQAEALAVGDRLGIMHAGRLEQLGTPEACFQAPASRFVAGFLGEAAFIPGRVEGEVVHTLLGDVPAPPGNLLNGEVDVLVRPDDIALEPADAGNAEVDWQRYEGETRLYGLRLSDGRRLRVRLNHEQEIVTRRPVQARLTSEHPPALFPPMSV